MTQGDVASSRRAPHHRGRSGRRPGTEDSRPMEMAVGIALAIIAALEILLISRTVIKNSPN